MPSNKEGYMKLYYQKNRDKMFNNMLEKIECQSCGKIMMRGIISAHMKTKICMLKNEIKILKNISNEKSFKDLNYI